jgi:hypothetical protein
MVGRARLWRSDDGSKRRSSVDVSAASERVGREVIAGRKGEAAGLRGEEVDMLDGEKLVDRSREWS